MSAAYADAVTDEDSTLRKAFGQQLKAARLHKELTQDAVAGRFGIEKNTVSAWETGRGVPDALRLRALAKLYDTSADALLMLTIEVVQTTHVTDDLNEEAKRILRKAVEQTPLRERHKTHKSKKGAPR